jgi:diguanylate cyclase (GGDEF)-like protein
LALSPGRLLYWSALLSAFVLALIAGLVLAFRLDTAAPGVNMAGRQRMHLQKMATEALAVAHQQHHLAGQGPDRARHRRELEKARKRLRHFMARFERAHRGLLKGWPDKGIDPAAGRARQLLAEVSEQWPAYRRHLEAALEGQRLSHAQVDAIAEQSRQIWPIMDRVVGALEAQATRRIQRQYWIVVGLIAALGVLLLLALAAGLWNHRLERRAFTDPLTGLGNRGWLGSILEAEIQRSQRHNRPFSIAMLDLDHFKAVNDRHGHSAGDWVLQRVARILRQQLRAGDSVARWGGEELVALLPETAPEDARQVAERIRGAVAGHREEGIPAITVSVGLAAWQPGDTAGSVLERADAALYRAKAQGRDRVTFEPAA